MRLSLLLIPLALAGCGEKPARSLPVPPADRLECPDEPAVPPEPVTDEATADYMVALRKSWQGCRSDVDWLRTWLKTLAK